MINNKFKKAIKNKQQQYLLVRAELETLEETNRESQQKVLNENYFITENENERITSLENDYLMSESNFKKYCNLVFEENKKIFPEITDPDRILEADKKIELRKIEDDLLKLQLEITPLGVKKDIEKAQNHWKYREQALDLILRLDI